MTSNQIEFAKHKENQRHNRFTETESKRHNVQEEGIGWGNLGELSRHNRETESINWFSAANLATYQDRTGRAALEQAGAARSQAETAAINAQTRKGELKNAKDITSESIRHNQATESIGETTNEIQADKVKKDFQLGTWHSINETYGNILETVDTANKVYKTGRKSNWIYD